MGGKTSSHHFQNKETGGSTDRPAAFTLELDMEEKIVICIYCGNQLTLTASQQERLRASGFTEPKWCKECRNKKAKIGLSRGEVRLKYKRKQSRSHLDQHHQY
jgi:hypothetical protein